MRLRCGIICRCRRPPPASSGSLLILHKWSTTCYSRPFICTTQLSEWRATSIKCVSSHYTIIYRHTRAQPRRAGTHTHRAALSAERVCWYYKTTLVFCVWERSRQRERERESVRPFRVLRVGRPFPFYGTEISNWPVTFALIAISGKQVMHICLKCLLTAFYEARKCNPIMIWLARERERDGEGERRASQLGVIACTVSAAKSSLSRKRGKFHTVI